MSENNNRWSFQFRSGIGAITAFKPQPQPLYDIFYIIKGKRKRRKQIFKKKKRFANRMINRLGRIPKGRYILRIGRGTFQGFTNPKGESFNSSNSYTMGIEMPLTITTNLE